MANQPARLSGERIAYVINSAEGGGAALPVPAIARRLEAHGAQVRVFALTRRDGRALPAMEAAGLDPLVREGGEADHAAALRWLAREVRAWGATRLWTSLSRATILGLLVGPRLGLPVISWQHAAYLKPWNERLMRWLQGRAELWIGDSPAVTALTAERLGVPPERLACWPIFALDEQAPRARAWQPGEPVQLGSLGRLHPVKGYDVLIDALGRLRREGVAPPLLTIGGDGAERARLLARAEAEGIALSLPGYVEDPGTFLAGLHLYCQPSRSEGFCIAAHEAMGAGLPVVASAVGELATTIRDGVDGRLGAPGDPAALAAVLGPLLAAPEQLEAMGRAARERLNALYSPAAFVRAGDAVISRLSAAGDRPTRSPDRPASGRSS